VNVRKNGKREPLRFPRCRAPEMAKDAGLSGGCDEPVRRKREGVRSR
jgi:hypothetical protein